MDLPLVRQQQVWCLGRSPSILPFYHTGMARIMPEHERLPRVGNAVTVTVGEPVDVSDISCRCGQKGEDQHEASTPTTLLPV